MIIIDKHKSGCTCSYCHGDHALKWGLNIPKDWKAWQSWWVIKYWPNRYFRWGNTWLRWFK